MGKANFWKGLGAGMAMGLALGLTLHPTKRKCSGGVERLLKLAASAVGELGSTLGF